MREEKPARWNLQAQRAFFFSVALVYNCLVTGLAVSNCAGWQH
jgi:hypothetical protein